VVEATEVEGADYARLFEIGTQLAELQRSVEAMKERSAARALGIMRFEESAKEGADGESDDAETSSVGSSVPESVDSMTMAAELEPEAHGEVPMWLQEVLTEEDVEAVGDFLNGRHWTGLTEADIEEMWAQIRCRRIDAEGRSVESAEGKRRKRRKDRKRTMKTNHAVQSASGAECSM
jgi:hypothetical protein